MKTWDMEKESGHTHTKQTEREKEIDLNWHLIKDRLQVS